MAHRYGRLSEAAALAAAAQARDAIACTAGSPADLAPLSLILGAGRIVLQVDVDGPHEQLKVADPALP